MNFRALLSVLTGGVATLVLIASWSVASPIGSVPDSSFHLSSIWCANSAQSTKCPIEETIPGQPRAFLPTSLIYPTCFSSLPDGLRACTANIETEGSASTKPNQLAGLNPSGFYSALGTLSGQPVEGRVVLMRMVSGCFSALLITCSAMLLYPGERRRFLLLALTTHLPLGLFLTASVNSSGVTLAAVIAAIPFGVRLNRATRRFELAALLAGASLLLVMAANLRKDAPILVLVVLLVLTARRLAKALTRSSRALILGVLLISALTVTISQGSGSARIIRAFLDGFLRVDGTASLTLNLVLTNAVGVPLLWFAAFGGWAPSDVAGLGLMDIVPPWPTAILTGGALLVLLRQSKSDSRSVSPLTSLTLLGLSWLIPFWTLTISELRVGEQLQPRYVLPLLASSIITASLCTPSDTRVERWTTTCVVIPLTLAHFFALSATVLHYSYDRKNLSALLTETPAWRWTTIHPFATIIAGSIAFALLVRQVSRGDIFCAKSVANL